MPKRFTFLMRRGIGAGGGEREKDSEGQTEDSERERWRRKEGEGERGIEGKRERGSALLSLLGCCQAA